jgi:RNA polymerase sigma-70 factor, ECF subfamily
LQPLWTFYVYISETATVLAGKYYSFRAYGKPVASDLPVGQVTRSKLVSELESEWLSRALRGDQEAFSRLVETYQNPVFNLCYRMLGNANDAEDAAQETFLRAYNGVKRYDKQRSFSTWLLSIAAHYCIDQIRKRRFTVMSFDELPYFDPADQEPGPESSLLRKQKQRQVQSLLENLPSSG